MHPLKYQRTRYNTKNLPGKAIAINGGPDWISSQNGMMMRIIDAQKEGSNVVVNVEVMGMAHIPGRNTTALATLRLNPRKLIVVEPSEPDALDIWFKDVEILWAGPFHNRKRSTLFGP